MRLKFTVDGASAERDVLVTAEGSASVGDIASALAKAIPDVVAVQGENLTIRPSGRSTGIGGDPTALLDPNLLVGESSLRSGARVNVAPAEALFDSAGHRRGEAVATLRVHSGPDRGQEFSLTAGSTTIGRDASADVVLKDPFVSKRHIRVSVTDSIEVVDLGSANGTLVGGDKVQRAVVRPNDRIEIGDTSVSITPLVRLTGDGGTALAFNRPPVVHKPFEGGDAETPDPPNPTRPVRFPFVALVAPLVLAVVMASIFIPIYRSRGQDLVNLLPMFIFMGLSPLLMVGSYLDQRRQAKVEAAAELKHFNATLEDLWKELLTRRDDERTSRLEEAPSTADGLAAAARLAPLMWSRRTDRPGFLDVRLGTGRTVSRTVIKLPDRRRTEPRFWSVLAQVRDEFSTIDDVPIVGALTDAGGVGVSGPREVMSGVARALVAQVACLHSPADVAIMAVGSSPAADGWDWLKWLPHVGSAHSPVQNVPLADSAGTAIRLVSQLEELVAERSDSSGRPSDEPIQMPRVLLVVLDDAPIDRSRLVSLAEVGPKAGVHVLWCAGTAAQIPACCRAFVDLESDGRGVAGLVHLNESVSPIRCESVGLEVAAELARKMSPTIDAGARIDDESDLPRNVSFLTSLGTDLARSPDTIVERWRANDPALAGLPRKRKGAISLRAVVGQGSGDAFALDLRTQGPHALVGGTTGAGKSEFLQSWVLALAASQSPQRVTFLFVDYKGGSAFARCTELPHSVGLVTDLDEHLVRRALTSLRAELTYREQVLNRYKVKDLVELEKKADAEQLPSLVIIVDEFAALAQEIPEFVDGVMDVAQRGRSLGLHLILATQRPAGVIKGNLRANTNLRVALRMADAEDSDDVIGDEISAGFDPAVPGRAAAKTGPGRINVFQSLYVGGSTPDVAPRPEVEVESLAFGAQESLRPESDDAAAGLTADATDLDRVVDQITSAAKSLELSPPRKPWLPVLAPVYDLEQLPQRTDAALVIGMQDLPHLQTNEIVHFKPDEDGNMSVVGTGGSGKSTVLRTLAVAAAGTMRGGPCDVYALDFGSRGLAMLDALPHVGAVVTGTDHERVGRLLRWLRDEVEERSKRYAAARASNITEYRSLSDQADERRILVLLDGYAMFRQEYELARSGYYNLFGQLAADGRAVGIHFVVTADRPGAIPASLAATIQQRVTLRLSDPNDYGTIGAPADVLTADAPPGRGLIDGLEVQVAVLGASPSLPKQADALAALARALERYGRTPARVIERLPDRIVLSDLKPTRTGRPGVGIDDDNLQPFGIDPTGMFLVVGPPASGRTTTVATIVSALASRGATGYLFTGPRSPLLNLIPWEATASTEDAAVDLAERLRQEIGSGRLSASADRTAVLVVEGLDGLSGGMAEAAIESLAKTALDHGLFVLGESEISALSQSYLLGSLFKQARRGIALQPDDVDGQTVFRTNFPRVSRSEFPPGRGIVVDAGRTVRVQMCLPE